MYAVLGGLASSASQFLGVTAVATAVGAGAVRYAAVLHGVDHDRVEKFTAYGFYFGAAFSTAIELLAHL